MKNLMKSSIAFLMSVLTVFALFVPSFAAEKTYKKGDIIEFGSYPQSQVTDTALIAELKKQKHDWKKETMTSDNNWWGYSSYNYIKEYADIDYNNKKYRALKEKTYSDGEIISESTEILYFEYESIEWIVLNPESGMLISKKAIDKQYFNDYFYMVEDGGLREINAGKEHYDACDYTKSKLRTWLNNTFYDDAFSESEKGKIKLTEIENNKYSDIWGFSEDEDLSKYEIIAMRWDEPIYKVPAYNNTKDKVFLLSVEEYYDFDFDENNHWVQSNEKDIAQSEYTSYASGGQKVTFYNGIASWWTRSAGGNRYTVSYFYPEWRMTTWWAFSSGVSCWHPCGVRPVICIDMQKLNEKPSTDKPVVEVMKGDIDGNGKITASDARTVLRMAAKLEPTTADALQIADMNSDGKLTASDARTILRKAAKLE